MATYIVPDLHRIFVSLVLLLLFALYVNHKAIQLTMVNSRLNEQRFRIAPYNWVITFMILHFNFYKLTNLPDILNQPILAYFLWTFQNILTLLLSLEVIPLITIMKKLKMTVDIFLNQLNYGLHQIVKQSGSQNQKNNSQMYENKNATSLKTLPHCVPA